MELLFTAFALLCLAACVVCVWAAYRHVSEAHEIVLELKGLRTDVLQLQGSHDVLNGKLKSLTGKFYAIRGDVDDPREHVRGLADLRRDGRIADHPRDAGGEVIARLTGATCENWLQAQVQGPHSEAARCECAYCATQRAARAADKARILAERNRPKANGSE